MLSYDFQKVLISEYHKAQIPMATATGYVRRENAVLDFVVMTPCLITKPPSGAVLKYPKIL